MRVGVVLLPTDPWPEARGRIELIEALGYDHLWTYDHLSWRHYRERPWFASIPWLTAAAATTSRIRVGPLVSSPNFRHPVNLAKETMTLDNISGGRAILGVGAGGPGFDSTVLGGELLPPRERAARLEEFVTVLDRLLREPAVTYHGAWYTVDEARMLPGCVQRPRVPIAIAAGGRRTLALAAQYADTWITEAGTLGAPETPDTLDAALRTQVDALARACDAVGRDPATIDRLYMVGWENERPLRSVDAFREFTGRLAALGFTDVVVHDPRADDPARDDPPEILEAIARDALPDVR
jgi:alkanesulfonate monooxygenase SsuD/methylene tetrahydromethanopterin reductase-like flavin-dependent oxidoreductase (luciferase family)